MFQQNLIEMYHFFLNTSKRNIWRYQNKKKQRPGQKKRQEKTRKDKKKMIKEREKSLLFLLNVYVIKIHLIQLSGYDESSSSLTLSFKCHLSNHFQVNTLILTKKSQICTILLDSQSIQISISLCCNYLQLLPTKCSKQTIRMKIDSTVCHMIQT